MTSNFMPKVAEQKKDIEQVAEKTTDLDVENKIDGEDAKLEEKKKFKKDKRQISKGRATIRCSYNNTIVNIADNSGAILGWCSSGLLGFKGAKKATPYAATQVVANVAEKVRKYGVKDLEVFVRGVGSGREASIRALANNGFDVTMIKDTTPIPHNGCRAKKPRRV